MQIQVEEQKRQLEEQRKQAEAGASTSLQIPGLDGQFASSLNDISIPDNLQDILASVRVKTREIEEQQERLKAVAAAGFHFDDPIVKKFAQNHSGKEFLWNAGITELTVLPSSFFRC